MIYGPMVQSSKGPVDLCQWCSVSVVQWSRDLSVRWSSGPVVQWTGGPVYRWSRGLVVVRWAVWLLHNMMLGDAGSQTLLHYGTVSPVPPTPIISCPPLHRYSAASATARPTPPFPLCMTLDATRFQLQHDFRYIANFCTTRRYHHQRKGREFVENLGGAAVLTN